VIPKECKRLAEVDFPIAVVSRHAAKEKAIRHGRPSSIHVWWSQKPMSACRAMLLSLLLPDPCDPSCPPLFKTAARDILGTLRTLPQTGDHALREALMSFVGSSASWDFVHTPGWLTAATKLVDAAYGGHTPLVVDPFAGGGAIPLEALRIGCETFASDLNPVACLILKTILEDIPRSGPDLADELRRVGADIHSAAASKLRDYYSSDSPETPPITYIWARTIRCESPHCGAEIPLAVSFWLCKKPSRLRAVRYTIDRTHGPIPSLRFEVFEPRSDADVPPATVSRAKARCPCCTTVLLPERVCAQLAAHHGGADVLFDANGHRKAGASLLAVVTLHRHASGRTYRTATEADYSALWRSHQALAARSSTMLPNGLSRIPDEPLPPIGTLGFRVQRYGMLKWGDLFSARQQLAISVLAECIGTAQCAPGIKDLLAIVLDRMCDLNSSLCSWQYQANHENIAHLFSMHSIPIVWSFAEAVPTSESTGSFSTCLNVVAQYIALSGTRLSRGAQVQQADAAASPLPDEAAQLWFTDPPYYDAIPYADLSDFFFVWLKRTLPGNPLLRDPFDTANPLTPKAQEAVQDETKTVQGRAKDRFFFEERMALCFADGRRVLRSDGIGCVVFAHKTTEGWEALLSGLIKGGWVITASWPINTEDPVRLRARDSAALAATVHLICRPREVNAPIGDWLETLRELPKRIHTWMDRLTAEGIRGADLVFACIGPAMEVYSRYSRIEDAEGREIPLGGDPAASEPYRRGFLAYVWETVGRIALAQVLGDSAVGTDDGSATALEEDARLTALFLWTLQTTNGSDDRSSPDQEEPEVDEDYDDEEEGRKRASSKKGFSIIYDVARRFAQPLGIHLDQWEGRIISIEKGIVRLLPVTERARQLFGTDSAHEIAERIEKSASSNIQLTLFSPHDQGLSPDLKPKKRGTRGKKATSAASDTARSSHEVTTLDRLHTGMLLQASGQASALRALLKTEQERGSEFIRLANALSALYPAGSEEKRLLDAMLLAMPR
jgi:putative DNA methylase